MHTHMKPFLPPLVPNPAPQKPAKSSAAGAGSEVSGYGALQKDRGGSGSRSRQKPERETEGGERNDAPSARPAASLAALLTRLDLDAAG